MPEAREVARRGSLVVWATQWGIDVDREDGEMDTTLQLDPDETRWLFAIAGPSILLEIGAVPTLKTQPPKGCARNAS